MGGDHKCPVCQATFTRPQHVARHMRSHTGDRPYKCLYCGDQFARSDLLSRHVNKCHSNEKPLQSANARRKGSAALRATTSKQACDQCVQSSLPCDGANPCSKCVQRKCRCTFVKFHRQTAPTGPGHAPPPLPSSSNPIPDSPSTRLRHDQLPSASSASSLGALYAENFGFPAVYPPRMDHSTSLPSDSPIDYTSRYRAHAAELAHRNASNGSSIRDIPPSYPRQGIYPPHTTSSWTGWEQGIVQDPQDMRFLSHDQTSNGGDYAPSPVMGSYPLSVLVHRRQSLDYSGSESGASVSESPSVSSSSRSSSVHLPLSLPDHDVPMAAPFQPSRNEVSFQPPSLRTQDIRPSTSPNSPTSIGAIPLQHAHSQPTLQADGNPSFSSAFGLMSLDDPNVLAGLAADSAPFFSQAAMGMEAGMDPDATPMPMTLTQSQPPPFQDDNSKLEAAGMRRASTTHPPSQWSPSQLISSRERDKEKDTRELREFWKEYIRSPGVVADTPGGYRRSRVNSLPSKTPLAGPGVMGSQGYWYPYGAGQLQSSGTTPIAMVLPRRPSTGTGVSAGNQGEGQAQNGPARHLHGSAEDLRSYEAAVLARKAPTNLSLNPRRRGTVASTSGIGSGPPMMFARGGSASVGASPTIAPFIPASVRGALNKNRINEGVVAEKGGDGRWGDAMDTESTSTTTTAVPPISTSSSSSSLANVFGASHGSDPDSTSFRRGSVSREGSVVSEMSDMSNDGAGGIDSMRPSFKRLPSQTLEPLNAKRAQINDPRVDSDDDSEAARQARAGRGLSLAERRRLASGKLAAAGNFELDLGGLDKF